MPEDDVVAPLQAGKPANGGRVSTSLPEGVKAIGTVFKDDTSGTIFELYMPTFFDVGDHAIATLVATGPMTGVIPPPGWTLVSSRHDLASGRSEWILWRRSSATDPVQGVATTENAVSHRAAMVYTPTESLVAQCSQPATEEELKSYGYWF